MGLRFEWDPKKAENNLKEHAVSFVEASTVFADPLAGIRDDPDHSETEERYIIIGCRKNFEYLWSSSQNEMMPSASSVRGSPQRAKGSNMKKKIVDKMEHWKMRGEYDFSNARPNKYAKKYAEGTNVVVIDPDLIEFFPDAASVNTALRALVSVFPKGKSKGKAISTH